MTMRRATILTAAAAVGVVAAAIVAAPQSTADTPGCASHAEYNDLVTLMSTGSVANLFDTNGTYGPGGQDTFVRNYQSCWNPDDVRVTVWYDQDSALSLRWDTRST